MLLLSLFKAIRAFQEFMHQIKNSTTCSFLLIAKMTRLALSTIVWAANEIFTSKPAIKRGQPTMSLLIYQWLLDTHFLLYL